jgi:hypothetical protein
MARKCPKGKKWNRKTQKCIWKRKVVRDRETDKKTVFKKQDPDVGYVEYTHKEGKGRGKQVYKGVATRYEGSSPKIATLTRTK